MPIKRNRRTRETFATGFRTAGEQARATGQPIEEPPKPKIFIRPQGTPPEQNLDISTLSPEQRQAIALEGQMRNQREIEQTKAQIAAKLEREELEKRKKEASPLLNQIGQSPQTTTEQTQTPTSQPNITPAPSSNLPFLPEPNKINQENLTEFDKFVLENQRPLAAGAFGLALGGAAIPLFTAGTATAATGTTAATIFGKTAALGGALKIGGATIGLSSVLGFIGKNRAQNIKEQKTIYTKTQDNFGDIINAVNAGTISQSDAVSAWNRNLNNVKEVQGNLKQLTKNVVGQELSNAQDELIVVSEFLDEEYPYLELQFKNALITPNPNAIAVMGERDAFNDQNV